MKRIAFGLIIGFMMGFAATAIAAPGEITTAIYSTFNFKVNGQESQVDANPLVAEGKSYLPVTEIGNMLGYDVTYKADSRTIEFTEGSDFVVDPVYRTKEYQELVQRYNDKLQEWQEKNIVVDEMNEEVKRLNEEVEFITNHISVVESSLDSIPDDKKTAVESGLEEWKGKLETAKTKLSELQAQLPQAEEELEQIIQERDELQALTENPTHLQE